MTRACRCSSRSSRRSRRGSMLSCCSAITGTRSAAGRMRSPRSRRTSRTARTSSSAKTRTIASISPMRTCGFTSRRRRSSCSSPPVAIGATIRASASGSRGRLRRPTAGARGRCSPTSSRSRDQHPEVWLVDGQCALSLGDVNSALALGRRYSNARRTARRPGMRSSARRKRRAATSPMRAASSKPRTTPRRVAGVGSIGSRT